MTDKEINMNIASTSVPQL